MTTSHKPYANMVIESKTCRFILVIGTGTGEIEFWDPRQRNTLLLRFQAHKKYIGTCAFSSDGLLLGTGADDETFRLWSLLSP
eukprot:m.136466 g.136466  ORF g.136466 m.136466 type:complete len:83 (-) comp15873_c0_seq14:126-374(-)